MGNEAGIRAVTKAMRILRAFDRDARSLGIVELSGLLGYPRSVTYKLVRTLVDAQLLVQDHVTRRYQIGPGVLSLASRYLKSKPLVSHAQPVLDDLAGRTGHSAALGVLDGSEVLFVAVSEGTGPIKAGISIGDRRTLHASAAGKILLAGISDDVIGGLLGSLTLDPLTPFTITDSWTLKDHIGAVRRAGVAYNLREGHLDVSAVAAAVRDHEGSIIAAISLAFPASVDEAQLYDSLSPAVKESGQRLSTHLGRERMGSLERPQRWPGEGSVTRRRIAGDRIPTIKEES